MANIEIEFIRNNRLLKELLLINGPPRSGKAMLCSIMSSFARVEIERVEPILDAIPLFYKCDKMKKDAAVTILRREIDMKLSHSMVSRGINFRFTDRSGVFNCANSLRYIRRLFLKDGDVVVERIKEERPIFQIMTHNMVEMIDLYFDAFEDGLRMIDMVRHPVDRVYSMYERGDGTEIGNNPRFIQLTIKSKGGDLPWYAIGWEDEYLKDSPIDRLIKIVERLNKKRIDKYKSLSQARKDQILLIPFEKFVISPDSYLDSIAKFIDSETTKYTKKTLKRERVPRKLDLKEREKELNLIKETASKECMEILSALSEEYESLYF